MKTHGKASLVLGCLLAACLSSTAMAKTATMKDLVGKKICWSSPNSPVSSSTTTYYPGGKYYNTYWGNGVFTGTHNVTDKGSFEAHTEKLPDGTLKSTVIVNGANYEYTGRCCQ
jgi:hypothetical protein